MTYIYIGGFTATLVMAEFARADKEYRQMWALLISAALFLSLYLEH